MEVEHLLGEDWQFATFQQAGSTVVVTAEDDHDPVSEDVMVMPFDLRERVQRRPGRGFTVRGPVHLGVLVSLRPEPVLAYQGPEGLTVTDPWDGGVLKNFPLEREYRQFDDAYDLILTHHEGRDLLFLHEDARGGPYDRILRTWDLATGLPIPGSAGEHKCYRLVSGRLTFRHGYLAHPTSPVVVDHTPDDFHVVNAIFLDVEREGDGTGPFVGSVRVEEGFDAVPEGRAVDVARAGGRTYLAEAGDIFTLPELERVFPVDLWAVVSRVTEWAGRPVAVLVRKPAHLDENRDDLIYEPLQLSFMFLDVAAPVWHVLPWTVPLRPFDLLATPEGTIMVSSSEGVHVVRVDPEETVRSAERG
ncbi:hypothetical protein IDM40_21345 [Nocardiopsis sp. HNM0947]|uniref:Uncharacterized protein n=1 Tax=Nocardiopsis coralli TaxID=2772213 RepID=A0ABR9PBK8_9ACTN|nr:hypothetical protein [Nocardiopsis coralli]MBE3001218.1 hypothetical protein [Nocardiopsis coralli]